MRLLGNRRVQHDDPDSMIIVYETMRPAGLLRCRFGEGRLKGCAVIVIAWNGEERNLQVGKQIQRVFELARCAVIRDVPGHEDNVRSWLKGIEMADRFAQAFGRVDLAISEFAGVFEVRVGKLGNKHAGLGF